MPEPAACPVCSEPLPDRPARCFRCETALSAWWPFEESLGALAAAGVPRGRSSGPARPARLHVWRFAVLLLLVALALSLRRPTVEAPASPPPPTRPAAARPPAPTAPPPAVVVYRVQRGDSLWRIAAAFTGDGRRWRALWPEAEGRRLVPGTVLEVPASLLPADPRPAPPAR